MSNSPPAASSCSRAAMPREESRRKLARPSGRKPRYGRCRRRRNIGECRSMSALAQSKPAAAAPATIASQVVPAAQSQSEPTPGAPTQAFFWPVDAEPSPRQPRARPNQTGWRPRKIAGRHRSPRRRRRWNRSPIVPGQERPQRPRSRPRCRPRPGCHRQRHSPRTIPPTRRPRGGRCEGRSALRKMSGSAEHVVSANALT